MDTREVCYPWHPWHGQVVSVYDAIVRSDRAVFRCGTNVSARPVEVPQWMFESARCRSMRIVAVPVVCCQALRQLKALLQIAPASGRGDVIQAQHRSLPPGGGADVTNTGTQKRRSTRPIPSAPQRSHLARAAPGSSAKDREPVGATVARAPSERACPRQCKGGRS